MKCEHNLNNFQNIEIKKISNNLYIVICLKCRSHYYISRQKAIRYFKYITSRKNIDLYLEYKKDKLKFFK
jgi:hypothetical protein